MHDFYSKTEKQAYSIKLFSKYLEVKKKSLLQGRGGATTIIKGLGVIICNYTNCNAWDREKNGAHVKEDHTVTVATRHRLSGSSARP
jgi:hypothetical protein